MQGRCNQDPNARMVTIMITDCCPECEPNHIDIQVAFASQTHTCSPFYACMMQLRLLYIQVLVQRFTYVIASSVVLDTLL